MQERLQKILSGAGVCFAAGSGKADCKPVPSPVNGEQAQVGDRADLDTDTICVNGRRIGGHESYHTIVLYKPGGCCHNNVG